MANARGAMSSDDTMRVLERHGAAAAANDLQAIMADYAEAVQFGSDTFVVRDARIAVQTVAMPAW